MKPGTRLLGYELLGLLAQGGMAEVYLARKPGAPPVVVKRIRPNLAEDPQFVGMFMDEARVAQSLSHANVVKVLEVGKDGREYALAMEFLDGRNLLRVARACFQRRAYVPYELMARIVSDTLAGLEHAHGLKGSDGKTLNLVHRDMSPENIMITYAGGVKVVDFGIAKAANMEGRTQAGVIKGKLGYVAPEAVLQDKLDGRADIFAMGVTLYELLTYTVPFSGQNEIEVLTAITQKEPQAPTVINASVPKELEDICLKALVKDRTKRWQTAAEMRKALERFIRGTGKGTSAAYLGAFMEALFPRTTDKDRVKVTEMLARTDAPTGGASARNASGPSWSKALMAESGMSGEMSAPAVTPARSSNVSAAPAPQDDQATHMEQMDPAMLEELRSGLINNAGRATQDEPEGDGEGEGGFAVAAAADSTSVEMSRGEVDAALAAPPQRSASSTSNAVASARPRTPAAAPKPAAKPSSTRPSTPAAPPARRTPPPPPTSTREVPAAPAATLPAPAPPSGQALDPDEVDLDVPFTDSGMEDAEALTALSVSAAAGPPDPPDPPRAPLALSPTVPAPPPVMARPMPPSAPPPTNPPAPPRAPAPPPAQKAAPAAPAHRPDEPDEADEPDEGIDAPPPPAGMHPVVALMMGMFTAAVLMGAALGAAHYTGVLALPLPLPTAGGPDVLTVERPEEAPADAKGAAPATGGVAVSGEAPASAALAAPGERAPAAQAPSASEGAPEKRDGG